MKILALHNPTVDDIRNALAVLREDMGYDKAFPDQKIIVRFSDEVSIRVDRRNIKKLCEARVNFFEHERAGLCYTFHSRSGYPISDFVFSKIASLSIMDKAEIKGKEIEKARAVQRRIHPNAWDNLREKAPEEFLLYRSEERLTLINMTRKFPKSVIRGLEEAFRNKARYCYRQNGEKRDWTIEANLCEDGIFRAWYSSEYAGCGNGQYYLLINPYTALFCEND